MTRASAPLPPGIRWQAAREEMVPVPGGHVFVRIDGDLASSKPPLVMVHGGPGSAHWYFLPATVLAEDRAVILYDQLDSGRSDRPNDPANWTVSRFVEELEAIRGHFGIARWHVLGQSWGGTLVLEYGAAHRDRLASLVIQSAFVQERAWIEALRGLAEHLPPASRELIERGGTQGAMSDDEYDAAVAAFEARHIQLRPPAPELAAYRAALPVAFNRAVYEQMWGRNEFYPTGVLRGYDGAPLLARLDGGRTLFVGGEHDEATPAMLGGFAAQVPGACFAVLPDAAHMLMSDNPVAYLALLRPWLAEHDR